MEILEAFPGPDGLKEFKELIKLPTQDKEIPSIVVVIPLINIILIFQRKLKEKIELPESFPSGEVIQAYLHPKVNHSQVSFHSYQISNDNRKNFSGLNLMSMV